MVSLTMSQPRRKMRERLAAAVIVGAALAGCSPSSGAPSTDGPLEMPSAEPRTRVVTLIAEGDGRERAVGNIRAVNTSKSANVMITGVTAHEPHNAEVGAVRLLRLDMPGVEVAGTGYPIPPLPADDGFESTHLAWEATIDAHGAKVSPGERINLIVGLQQADESQCSIINGVDVMYEVDGVEYVEVWNTTYSIELVDGEGCVQGSLNPQQ